MIFILSTEYKSNYIKVVIIRKMETRNISIHPFTENPTLVWNEMSKTQKVLMLNSEIPSTLVEPNKIRFVCMSDTHSLISNITFDIPPGDVFLHAGDFTKCGQRDEVIEFNKWLETLPHKHKIVIAGNHELSFDEKFSYLFKRRPEICTDEENQTVSYENTKDDNVDAVQEENIKQLLTSCVYLEDSGVEICGIKLYGTPWQPEYRGWAFNLKRGEECLTKWNKIPCDTDILITHTPPLGHGDLAGCGERAGCVELLQTVQHRVKPRYHVFGHIHEGYGVSSDGKTIFINASTCDINYIPQNLPVVFDVPKPVGYMKN